MCPTEIIIIRYIEPISGTAIMKRSISNLCGADNNLEIIKGDNETIEFTIQDSEGTLIDLTNAKVIFGIKVNVYDEEYKILKRTVEAGGSDSEILVTGLGTGEIYILPEDTEPLRDLGNDYYYELQVEFNNRTKTPISGEVCLIDDLVR